MELQKGDTIGIIALAGDCEKNKIDSAVLELQKLGYKVKLSKNIYTSDKYLAGPDEDKLAELHKFFEDPEIKLIMNFRGGYGAIRLINKIDYELIKLNYKPFVGYSDITALLLMIYKKTGKITYHGPMGINYANTSFSCGGGCPKDGRGLFESFSHNSLTDALSGKKMILEGKKIYKQGDAKGIIWGGNLATVVSLCGLDFIPDEDFIFFAEEINEPVYKIDRMFTQLFNIEKFRGKCKGVVLGDFLEVDNQEWLEEFFGTLPVPAVGGFKITHKEEMVTIPIGRYSELCGTTLVIE